MYIICSVREHALRIFVLYKEYIHTVDGGSLTRHCHLAAKNLVHTNEWHSAVRACPLLTFMQLCCVCRVKNHDKYGSCNHKGCVTITMVVYFRAYNDVYCVACCSICITCANHLKTLVLLFHFLYHEN